LSVEASERSFAELGLFQSFEMESPVRRWALFGAWLKPGAMIMGNPIHHSKAMQVNLRHFLPMTVGMGV